MDRFSKTDLLQLGPNLVALGYNSIQRGVIEFFDPQTGVEAQDNTFLNVLVPFFGQQVPVPVEDITLVPLSGQRFFAAWQTEIPNTTTNKLSLNIFGTDGARIGTEVEISSGDDRHPVSPSAFALSDGSVLLSWEHDSDHHSFQIYDQNLTPRFANPIEYTPIRGLDGPLQIRELSDRLAVFYAEETFDFRTRTVDSDLKLEFRDLTTGALIGTPQTLNFAGAGETQSSPEVLDTAETADGGMAVLYSVAISDGMGNDRRDVFVELYEADGTQHRSVFSPRAIDFGVDLAAVGLSSGSASREVKILGLPDGGYAILFVRTDDGVTPLQNFPDRDIYLMIYDANEARVLDPTRVNADQAGEQGGFDAEILENGELLVSYYSLDGGAEHATVQKISLGDMMPAGPPIDGTDATETLNGTAASERINGLGGYDWIIPGRGNDTVDGGTGLDMVSYSDAPEVAGRGTNFMLDLDLGAGTAELFGGETDQLISIERATGSIFADVMRGSDGNDEMRGLGDYDWFIATAGNDTLDGGNGQDMITFLEAASSGAAVVETVFSATGAPPSGAAVGGVTLNLSDPTQSTGLASGLTLTSVERVTGSSHQDVFYGDAQQNDFRGLGGYDWFVGSTGGRERYFGGDGLDTVTYFQSTSGVSASLRNGAGLFGGQETGYGSAGDAVRDLYFEIENLVGTNFDDSLTGNNERNQLSGLDGDDFLFGYGGIDYLKGGAGNDTLNGGAGSDYAIFNGNRADYTITRSSATDVTVTGADGTDSLISVEYFQFDDETANIWQFSIA
ncbi:calcium-binding protein [Tropicibacter sp. R16_0]|uniref:calcium-binding protein n=1 Tax=Tropicibacter sp. R16_0 TaxID=2821102 RepID=UPI00336AEA84